MDEHGIQRKCAGPKQIGHFAEKNRRVITSALVDRLPNVRTDEEGVDSKASSQFRRNVRRWPLCMEGNNLYIFNIRSPAQSLNQDARRCCHAMEIDSRTALDVGDRLCRGYIFLKHVL